MRRRRTAAGRAARRGVPTASRPTRPRATARSAGTRPRSWSCDARARRARGAWLQLRPRRPLASSSPTRLAEVVAGRDALRAAGRMAGDGGRASATSGAPGSRSMAIVRRRRRAVGSEGAPARTAARRPARAACATASPSTAAAASPPTRRAACASSSAAGPQHGIAPREDEGRARAGAATPSGSRPRATRSAPEVELFVDANGAYRASRRSRGGAVVSQARRDLVRGAGARPTTSTVCACVRDRAPARHGRRRGRVRLRRSRTSAHARGRGRRRACRPTPRAAAASPASSGSRRSARRTACRCRRTPRPRSTRTSAARSRPVRHLEYFHDHARIERCSSTACSSRATAASGPIARAPGLGIELKRPDAARFAS